MNAEQKIDELLNRLKTDRVQIGVTDLDNEFIKAEYDFLGHGLYYAFVENDFFTVTRLSDGITIHTKDKWYLNQNHRLFYLIESLTYVPDVPNEKGYVFNKQAVCLNPKQIIVYESKKITASVETAWNAGRWMFSYHAKTSTSGTGGPVPAFSNRASRSYMGAITMALENAKKYMEKYPKTNAALKAIERKIKTVEPLTKLEELGLRMVEYKPSASKKVEALLTTLEECPV